MSQETTRTLFLEMKRFSFAVFLLTFFCFTFLSGCKEDDEEPFLRFQTDNKSYSLKNAKLYLKFEGSYEGTVNYTYRDYLISDGDLIEGQNGWSMDDYTNATYFIAVELATANPNLPAAGNFSLHRYWDNVTNGSNLSYFFGGFDDFTMDTPNSNPTTPIVISGGTEPGDKMSIKFSGRIAYRSEAGDLTPFDGKLDFTGIVIDKRD